MQSHRSKTLKWYLAYGLYGLTSYQKIEHAGFYRDIISRNPPLIDDDGYEVDSDDDDERAQAAMAAAADIDPYSEVKIESKSCCLAH